MRLRVIFHQAIFVGAYGYSGMACLIGALISWGLFFMPISISTREKMVRHVIHYLCLGLVTYLQVFRLLQVDFHGLVQLRQRRGTIIAVNHPTYIDAILMMSQLPNVFCLMKSSLYQNPLIAAIARGAGYEDNGDSSQLIENCAKRLRRGETLLVFPEGTRTTTPPIGRLKRGFALMAISAKAPVVTVLNTSFNGLYLGKGQPFFAFPASLPLHYSFAYGQEFFSAANEQSRNFCQKIETHFRLKLPGQNG
jgi:1-acyl-sn-glycerol-3-phosphate acyltransferase